MTGNPETRRDFTDVRDTVRAYRLLGVHDGSASDPAKAVYNVSSARSVSAAEQVALLAELVAPVALLRDWDFRWSDHSVATSLAVFWGEALWDKCAAAARAANVQVLDYMIAQSTPEQRRAALAEAVARLEKDFGNWRTPWGDINRFQRNDGAIQQTFDDAKPSVPVPLTSSQWGSLASFGARAYPGTKKWYGTSGNSFVAVVEFGPKVHAKAVTAGGESGSVSSPHFNDQAQRYATGNLREVWFYREDVKAHAQREYHPGAN